MVELKSELEIEKLAELGSVTAAIFDKVVDFVEAGVSTKDIDDYAYELCMKYGVKPAFKGYRGYPASICISINDEVVHGIPKKDRLIKDGDIVSLDFGTYKDGFYSDMAVTVPVGVVSEVNIRLINATREALYKGIEKAVVGNRLQDISYAVQKHVEKNGFSVVRAFVGHGIGRSLHEDPQVPNFGNPGCGIRLKAGMVLAIEPMVNAGTYEVKIKEDGWTAVTADGKMSAHFEHTVAITNNGPRILTEVKEAYA